MTAKIIQFKSSKKKKSDDPKPEEKLTNFQIFVDVLEDVLLQWQSAATKNKLNEFIRLKLPPNLVGDLYKENPYNDFINDLNIISTVEQKLGIRVAVFYPNCTVNNPYGWTATFRYSDTEIYSTPPDMVTEANARALNILLYLSFNVILKSLGRK